MNYTPRVVHLVPALFGQNGGVVGGAERYVLELARNMARETPTTLVTFSEKSDTQENGNLKIKVIGDPWYVRGQRSNPIAFAPLLSALRGADVVHCHQQHVLSTSFVAALGRISGRRVFVSDLGGGGWDISGYVSTDRWFRGHLHISQFSRKIFGHEGKSWAHVIYGGTDTEKFSPDPAVPKDQSVLFVGRLLAHKGVNDLISALPEGMKLRVIGQPYDEKFFLDLQSLASGKAVEFRSDFDDASLVHSYRTASCIVLPSVYRDLYGQESRVPELLGQTLLEGMACGLPAICTDVASMPEIVEDGVTGFVVPPNDPATLREKLTWLRDRPEEAEAMGMTARQTILERFTWARVVKRCLEIYGNPERQLDAKAS